MINSLRLWVYRMRRQRHRDRDAASVEWVGNGVAPPHSQQSTTLGQSGKRRELPICVRGRSRI